MTGLSIIYNHHSLLLIYLHGMTLTTDVCAKVKSGLMDLY